MKLLVDMNLSPIWAPFLEGHGFEAVHWSVVGAASAPDADLMDYAAANGFVLFTHDLDFGMLLALRRSTGPSVLLLRAQNVMPDAIGNLVLRALGAARVHLQNGALVVVDPDKYRIRILPIERPAQ